MTIHFPPRCCVTFLLRDLAKTRKRRPVHDFRFGKPPAGNCCGAPQTADKFSFSSYYDSRNRSRTRRSARYGPANGRRSLLAFQTGRSGRCFTRIYGKNENLSTVRDGGFFSHRVGCVIMETPSEWVERPPRNPRRSPGRASCAPAK